MHLLLSLPFIQTAEQPVYLPVPRYVGMRVSKSGLAVAYVKQKGKERTTRWIRPASQELNGICRECRELDRDNPKISSETEKYGICGMCHGVGLETRILFYQSLGFVHVCKFVR